MILARVYIAGPYTVGDPQANVNRAIDAWHAFADAGFIPFCPHLSHYLHVHRHRQYAEWLRHDLQWLALCDAVLRLPGESFRADSEVAFAVENRIPVFASIDELHDAARP